MGLWSFSFSFFFLNSCFQTHQTTPLPKDFICSSIPRHVTSLTTDFYHKLNFIMVIVRWFQLYYSNLNTTVSLFDAESVIQFWFLHTYFDSQRKVSQIQNHLLNLQSKKFQKIHKTVCWNIQSFFFSSADLINISTKFE